MAIVLHLTLISSAETPLFRSKAESPFTGSEKHFTEMESDKDIPLAATLHENLCEFNLF
jgi:hypothetical protein